MDVNTVLVFSVFVGTVWAGQHDAYSGYTVYGVSLHDESDQRLLHDLEHALNLDIWQHGAPGLRDAEVLLSPQQAKEVLPALDRDGVTHYLKIADVARHLENFDIELASYRSSRSGRNAVPFEDYPRYAEVDEYIERIAATYPDIVTIVTAGNSYEGRPIKYLRISTTNFTDTSKPIYFMDAMIHAREWVTTPVALYSIHRLVEDLRDEDRDLLENTDWIILPIVNPDGYEHTHVGDRIWRRTRSVNPAINDTCLGVDANRNFDIAFNTVGVSPNPCTQTYPGVFAFSEPETQIVRDLLFEYLNRTQVYLNIHSQGNWILFGYGFNSSLPENVAQLHHVGSVMGAAIDALRLPDALYYRVGNSAYLLYATSGSAQDYAQAIGVPFSYTLELPGYGYGHQVPPTFIAQINRETWAGIAASARLARIYYDVRVGNY